MLNIYKYYDDYQSLDGIEKYKQKLISIGNMSDILQFAKDMGRFKDAEEYIMKDPHTAFLYARDVIKGRWEEAEPYIMTNPKWAYHYAYYILNGRWVEAEKYIMKEPYSAFSYAQNVLSKDTQWTKIPDHKKGRWIEAEPYIKTSDVIWKMYKKHFGIK